MIQRTTRRVLRKMIAEELRRLDEAPQKPDMTQMSPSDLRALASKIRVAAQEVLDRYTTGGDDGLYTSVVRAVERAALTAFMRR